MVVDYFYFFCKFSGEKKFSSTAKIVPEHNNVTAEEGKKLDIFGIKTISSTREGRNNYFLHCNFDYKSWCFYIGNISYKVNYFGPVLTQKRWNVFVSLLIWAIMYQLSKWSDSVKKISIKILSQWRNSVYILHETFREKSYWLGP